MKLGRPSPERERQIQSTVLDLVRSEPSGLTFKQLVEEAAKKGISKPTLWRHLTKFVELGLVLHKDKYYKRSPVSEFSAKIPRFFLYSKAHGQSLESATALDQKASYVPMRNEDWKADDWKPDDRREVEILAEPDMFPFFLNFTIMWVLGQYLTLLEMIRNAPNPSVASDLTNILIASDVTRPLTEFARFLWEFRDKISIGALDGKELGFTVHIGTPPKGVPLRKGYVGVTLQFKRRRRTDK